MSSDVPILNPLRRADLLEALTHPVWSTPLASLTCELAASWFTLHAATGCGDLAVAPLADADVVAAAGPDTLVLDGCETCGTRQLVRTVLAVHRTLRSLTQAVTNLVAAAGTEPADLLFVRNSLDPTWAFTGQSLADRSLGGLHATLDDHARRDPGGAPALAPWRAAVLQWLWTWPATQMPAALRTPTPRTGPHRVLVNAAMATSAQGANLHLQQPVAAHATEAGDTFGIFAVDDDQLTHVLAAVVPVGPIDRSHRFEPWALPFGLSDLDAGHQDALATDPTVWRLVLPALQVTGWPTDGDLAGLLTAAAGSLTAAGDLPWTTPAPTTAPPEREGL